MSLFRYISTVILTISIVSAAKITIYPAQNFELGGRHPNDHILKETAKLYNSYIDHSNLISGLGLTETEIHVSDIDDAGSGVFYIEDKNSKSLYYCDDIILSLNDDEKKDVNIGDKLHILYLFNEIYFASKQNHFPLNFSELKTYNNFKEVELNITTKDLEELYKELEIKESSYAYSGGLYGNIKVLANSPYKLTGFIKLIQKLLPEKSYDIKRDRDKMPISINLKLMIVDDNSLIKEWYKNVLDKDQEQLSLAYEVYTPDNLKHMLRVVGESPDNPEYKNTTSKENYAELFRIITMMINGFGEEQKIQTTNLIDPNQLDQFIYVLPKGK